MAQLLLTQRYCATQQLPQRLGTPQPTAQTLQTNNPPASQTPLLADDPNPGALSSHKTPPMRRSHHIIPAQRPLLPLPPAPFPPRPWPPLPLLGGAGVCPALLPLRTAAVALPSVACRGVAGRKLPLTPGPPALLPPLLLYMSTLSRLSKSQELLALAERVAGACVSSASSLQAQQATRQVVGAGRRQQGVGQQYTKLWRQC